MAESDQEREDLLRSEYMSQTARMHWHDLQTWYARGCVIGVDSSLNLVEVAVQLGQDNTAQFEWWISEAEVVPVTDDQAKAWYETNQEMWAVVAPPWVLVQPFS